MHRFNIIHADIKPDNIVFSQSANKPVFIDFGFSSVIKENAGYKKLTHFKGSPGFCSGEMLNLLSVNSRRDYVDLYYNDLYSLKSAFNQC
jgi:serine/threonine protein kinase